MITSFPRSGTGTALDAASAVSLSITARPSTRTDIRRSTWIVISTKRGKIMSKLYQLVGDYQRLEDSLDEYIEMIEAGEMDEAVIWDTLDGIEGELAATGTKIMAAAMSHSYVE